METRDQVEMWFQNRIWEIQKMLDGDLSLEKRDMWIFHQSQLVDMLAALRSWDKGES